MSTIITPLTAKTVAPAILSPPPPEYKYSGDDDLQFADLADIPEIPENENPILAPLLAARSVAKKGSANKSDGDTPPESPINNDLFPAGRYSFTGSFSSDGSLDISASSAHDACESCDVVRHRRASSGASGRGSTIVKNCASRCGRSKRDARTRSSNRVRSVSLAPRGLKTESGLPEPVPLNRSAGSQPRKEVTLALLREEEDDRPGRALISDEPPVETSIRGSRTEFRRCKSESSEKPSIKSERGQRSSSFNWEEKREAKQLLSRSEHVSAAKVRQASRMAPMQRAQSSARLRLQRSLSQARLSDPQGDQLKSCPDLFSLARRSSGSNASANTRTQQRGLGPKGKPPKGRRTSRSPVCHPTKNGKELSSKAEIVNDSLLGSTKVQNQTLNSVSGGVPPSEAASISALMQMVADLQKEVSQLRQEVKELKAGGGGGAGPQDETRSITSKRSSHTSLLGFDDESDSNASFELEMCVTSPQAA